MSLRDKLLGAFGGHRFRVWGQDASDTNVAADFEAVLAEVHSEVVREAADYRKAPEPSAEAWKRRALRAEGAVYHALWMRPLGPHWAGDGIESAEQMRARFHEHMERTYPDLIVRDQHRRIGVFHVADGCGCDPEAEDFEEQHSESGEDGEYLCSKKFLGYVCGSCEDEDGEGPAWKPYAVAWPCPPIVALDEPVKAVSA